MRTASRWSLVAAAGLLASGCQILNFTWTAPPTVAAGSVFVMDVTGNTDYGSGDAWAVFQVPNGFEVLGAGWLASPGRIAGVATVTTNPAALAPYTASPGHHLVGISGMAMIAQSFIAVEAKVYVRAPEVAGTYSLAMALAVGTAGALQPQLGLVGFQQVNGAAVRTVQVQPTPSAPPFSLCREGPYAGPRPLGAAIADFDRDGRQDVLLVNRDSIQVFNGGAGGLTRSVSMPTPLLPDLGLHPVAADLDGDGWMDFVTERHGVMFGVDGTHWTAGPNLAPSLLYAAIATGDFDGDSHLDLVFCGAGTCVACRGLGNRTFAPPVTFTPAGQNDPWLVAHDLDGDGRTELLFGMRVIPTTTQLWRVGASGQWVVGGTLPAAHGAVVVPIDGQPGVEIALADTAVRYRWNGQALVPTTAQQILSFDRAATADFDRDGRTDVLLTRYSYLQPSTLQLWRRVDATQFAQVALPSSAGFRVLNEIDAVLAGDFDGDTWPDAFVAMDAPLAWHNANTGAAPYGVGCGGATAAAPQLQALGTVGVGQSIGLQLATGLPGAATLFWAGTSRESWFGLPVMPLSLTSFGAPGCFLLAEPVRVVVEVADGAGTATLPVALPSLASTMQVTVYSQAAVLDFTANALGARFSGGIALKIQ